MELHDEEATQVDEEQCEDESSQKHAEAQPEETDIANAPSGIFGASLAKLSNRTTFNFATLCLFLPM